jgi:hypothetical protein
LVIRTDEYVLDRDTVSRFLKEALFRATFITDAFLGLSYHSEGGGCPVFRLNLHHTGETWCLSARPAVKRGGPESMRWFWPLHGIFGEPVEMRPDGRAATLDQAKANSGNGWRGRRGNAVTPEHESDDRPVN